MRFRFDPDRRVLAGKHRLDERERADLIESGCFGCDGKPAGVRAEAVRDWLFVQSKFLGTGNSWCLTHMQDKNGNRALFTGRHFGTESAVRKRESRNLPVFKCEATANPLVTRAHTRTCKQQGVTGERWSLRTLTVSQPGYILFS